MKYANHDRKGDTPSAHDLDTF